MDADIAIPLAAGTGRGDAGLVLTTYAQGKVTAYPQAPVRTQR